MKSTFVAVGGLVQKASSFTARTSSNTIAIRYAATFSPSSPTSLSSSSFTTLSSKRLQPPLSTTVRSTSTSTLTTMPQPPYQYRSDQPVVLDLSELSNKIKQTETLRQTAYDSSRKVQIATLKGKTVMEQQSSTSTSTSLNWTQQRDEILAEMKVSLQNALDLQQPQQDESLSASSADRTPRLANLSSRVEDVVRFLAMMHFLETGSWLSPSDCTTKLFMTSTMDSTTTSTTKFHVTDEEYLAGSCMGLCQDLQRYGLGRATARDVQSVETATTLVRQILDYLMQFDFRNGYLRRKYDGTKYALKTLETVLYELSVTGAIVSTDDADSNSPPTKKIRTEEPGASGETETGTAGSSQSQLMDELDALRSRLEHRDQLRETLIKKCRDGQKAAKQAIYALHRGDANKAFNLLKDCESCIVHDLLPIAVEEPPLRTGGSFGNVLEEYAEAKLFYAWLYGKDDFTKSSSSSSSTSKRPVQKANGTLLLPTDFAPVVELTPEEYLGGLCDLTGEIGRFCVQRGTLRDESGVRDCLEANAAVVTAIQSLERSPGGIGKKMDQLRRSVEKIERMLYEMSLSRAAGMKVATDVSESNDDMSSDNKKDD